jgi:hypothetical protein
LHPEYDDSFTLSKDPKRPVYYYEWFYTDRYLDGYYNFVARLNSSDGTSSWDNVSFQIDNSRFEWEKEDDDGILKLTHQLPWVPRGDEIPGPDYFIRSPKHGAGWPIASRGCQKRINSRDSL